MKKLVPLFILCIPGILALLIYSCKKDVVAPPGATSMTEEFDNTGMLYLKGWVTTDNTLNGNGVLATWGQGSFGTDKVGVWYGFTAYSYTSTPDEFAYSYIHGSDSSHSISSWFISPILSVKNGDKISFYTRGDTTGMYTDRMQVLMNHSIWASTGNALNAVGDFTKVLFDINKDQTEGGYPTTWTRYEYVFTDVPEKTNLRIAFRHFVENPKNARGVGIDLFQFQSN